jgi:hypothetical protein
LFLAKLSVLSAIDMAEMEIIGFLKRIVLFNCLDYVRLKFLTMTASWRKELY